jgi:hypothetical protein
MDALETLWQRIAVILDYQTKHVPIQKQQLRLLLDEEWPIISSLRIIEFLPLRDQVYEPTN